VAHGTPLLNDDGSASMATLLLLSHHAFRRDARRFAAALTRLTPGDASRAQALRDEWQYYRTALHHHHEIEDTRMFPHLESHVPALAASIDQLSADHRRLDPLLERGDRAFEALPLTTSAESVIAELTSLLDQHLQDEEREVLPLLRDAQHFPAPETDAEAELHAGGFAWSTQGIALEVLERVYELLPEKLLAHLPAARAAYEARCERTWGTIHAGASYTSVPDG
jgi:hemerythrin-like domain-containing protein